MHVLPKHYHHDVPQLNQNNYPYYEPEFRDRSDLSVATMPADDVHGAVYLIRQLLEPCDSLDHHLSILQILYTHITRSKVHQNLLSRSLTQFCVNQLYKYGNMHLHSGDTAYSDELLRDALATQARKYLLLILQTLSTNVDYLAKAFDYTPPTSHITGDEMLNVRYDNDFASVFRVTRIGIEQLIDNDVFMYLNQNTNNYMGVHGYAEQLVYSRTHFNQVINQILFDTASPENQIICSKILYNICAQSSQIQKYLSETNEATLLSSIISQLRQEHNCNNKEMYTNLIESLFIQAKYVQSLSTMVNAGLFTTLQSLALDDGMQLSVVCSQLLLEMLLTDNSLLKMVGRDFPYRVLLTQQRIFEFQEDIFRLVAVCVQEFTLAQAFTEHLDEVFQMLTSQSRIIPLDYQVRILNSVSGLPRAQLAIRKMLADAGDRCHDLAAAYQPETRDFFLQREQ